MKFIFADSLDYIDPRYDFIADRSPSDREPYWHDLFPHEALSEAPYDGILVSRAIADRSMASAKYTETQARRFRMIGAREFLRYRLEAYPESLVFGDCGAFAYHKQSTPPYTPENMIDFYEDAGFTHGCSVDHIIFQFDKNAHGLEGGTEEARVRYALTLDNAERFLKASKRLGNSFTPMGVVQGWSPDSMGEAARCLKSMGYSYLAVGGMVPLKAPEIHTCLDAIRGAVGPNLKLHILGFAKAEQIHEFTRHGIASFDTTSPLIRSFADERANYYLPNVEGGLHYFTAIRIPQALENLKLMRGVKSGILSPEMLVQQERVALGALREFDRGGASLEDVLDVILTYYESIEYDLDPVAREKKMGMVRARCRTTLAAKPWRRCNCAICNEIGVEVIIFRSSNRNKRRGIHNLHVFGRHVRRLNERTNHA